MIKTMNIHLLIGDKYMMKKVVISVGAWSTSIDSSSLYYHTIFSAMDETPSELRFDDWDWMPSQWSKWEILKDRIESFEEGSECTYCDRPIYYKDVEMLHRCFLDLPSHWPFFVIHDLSNVNEVTRQRLIASGSVDCEWPMSINKKSRDYNSLVEPWYQYKSLMSLVDLWHKAADRIATYSSNNDDVLILRGMWRNAVLMSQKLSHREFSWDYLLSLYGGIVGDMWSASFKEEIKMGIYYSVRLLTECSSQWQRGRIALLLEHPRVFIHDSLHPRLYRSSMLWGDGSLLWGRSCREGFSIEDTPPRSQLMSTWASIINSYIVTLARSFITTDSEVTDDEHRRVVRCLISVIGRKNGELLRQKTNEELERWRRCTRAADRALWMRLYERSILHLNECLNDPNTLTQEEMLDFPNEVSLLEHLKNVE